MAFNDFEFILLKDNIFVIQPLIWASIRSGLLHCHKTWSFAREKSTL